MTKQAINNIEGAVPPLPVFSQAVISKGLVYVSGSIGCDKEYNLVSGGILAQAIAALENMEKLLKGAGSRLDNILKVTVYMTHLARDFGEFNVAYAKFFDDVTDKPARTCIGVASLPMGAAVEVECIAEVSVSSEQDME